MKLKQILACMLAACLLVSCGQKPEESTESGIETTTTAAPEKPPVVQEKHDDDSGEDDSREEEAAATQEAAATTAVAETTSVSTSETAAISTMYYELAPDGKRVHKVQYSATSHQGTAMAKAESFYRAVQNNDRFTANSVSDLSRLENFINQNRSENTIQKQISLFQIFTSRLDGMQGDYVRAADAQPMSDDFVSAYGTIAEIALPSILTAIAGLSGEKDAEQEDKWERFLGLLEDSFELDGDEVTEIYRVTLYTRMPNGDEELMPFEAFVTFAGEKAEVSFLAESASKLEMKDDDEELWGAD